MNDKQIKRLEYEYRILSENAKECLWVFNFQARKLTYVSPNVFKLLGITAEDAMRDPLVIVAPEGSHQVGQNSIQQVIALYQSSEKNLEELSVVQDVQLFHKDGSLKQVEVTVRLIENKETGSLEILGISRDITERKRLEEELNRAIASKNEMIERLEKSKQTLKNVTLELNRKNRALREIATKDALTGIYNRYYFDRKIIEESERCQRYAYPLSIILFDIDNFKIVNDVWGHDVGDQVLIRIADAARCSIRKQDILARWGGEEFVVLMPHTDLQAATTAAAKLKEALSGLVHPDIDTTVTASFGVTEFMHGETKESWFRRVDHAMFCSKNNGGNCVSGIDWLKAFPHVKISLAWKSAWESGNPIIDDGHRQIIRLVNRTIEELLGTETAALPGTMEMLFDYVRAHFEAEDALLGDIDYTQAEVHRAAHQALQARLDHFNRQMLARTLESSVFISFLLDDLVISHILKSDFRFYPLLKAYGHTS